MRVPRSIVLAVFFVSVAAVPDHALADASPSYTAMLDDDGACLFELTAKWKHAPVAAVLAQWFIDGAFLATEQAPGTGPNGGAIAGHKALFQAGAFGAAPDTHSWQVLVQFYDAGGAQLASIWSNVDATPCAVASGQ